MYHPSTPPNLPFNQSSPSYKPSLMTADFLHYTSTTQLQSCTDAYPVTHGCTANRCACVCPCILICSGYHSLCPLHINYLHIITDKLAAPERAKQRDGLDVKVCACVCMQSTAAVFTGKIFERCHWSVGKRVLLVAVTLHIV